MAVNELEAKITADISGLESGLKKAEALQRDYAKSISDTQKDIAQNIQISKGYERALQNIQKELKDGVLSQKDYAIQLNRITRDEKETAIETANLRKQLTQLKREQSDLSKGTPELANKFTVAGKSIASTSSTATQLGKSLGSIGSGANLAGSGIGTLLSRFNTLRSSTGSNELALKSLLSSLAGPAGLALVITALIPLLSKYGTEIFTAGGKAEKLKRETEENTKKLQDFITGLSGVDKAQLNASKSSVEQLTKLGQLRKQIEDTSLSTEQRLDGIKQLRKEFPAYFQDISNEELLNGNASKSYNTLTNAIIKRAKATAATESIVENARKEFDLARKLQSVQEDLVKAEQNKTSANAAYLKGLKTGTSQQQLSASISAQGKVNDLRKEELSLMQQIGKMQLENQDLQAVVTENIVIEPVDRTQADAKYLKESEKLAKENAAILKRVNAQLFKDEQTAQIENAKETASQVTAIYRESGAAFKIPEGDGLDLGVEQAHLEIKELEKALASLKSKLSPEDFKLVKGFNIDQINAFNAQLKKFSEEAKMTAQITGQAISGISGVLADELKTDSELVNVFTKTMIDASAKMLQRLIMDSIKGTAAKKSAAIAGIAVDSASATGNAIKAGTETASSMGPAAAFMMPILIGAMLALVAGAFSKVKMAHGGIVPGGSFSGDKVPAMLNSGEMVLNNRQQQNLFRTLDGNLASLQGQSNGNGSMVASTVLRGEDIYIAVQRQSRVQKRFN